MKPYYEDTKAGITIYLGDVSVVYLNYGPTKRLQTDGRTQAAHFGVKSWR